MVGDPEVTFLMFTPVCAVEGANEAALQQGKTWISRVNLNIMVLPEAGGDIYRLTLRWSRREGVKQ